MGIKAALSSALDAFTESLSNSSIVKSGIDIASDVAETTGNKVDDVVAMLRNAGTEKLTTVANSISGATLSDINSRVIKSDIPGSVINNMSTTERFGFALRNPELLRDVDLDKKSLRTIYSSINSTTENAEKINKRIASLYDNDLLGKDYGWEGTFSSLTENQQQRILSEGRESIANMKRVAFGSADAKASESARLGARSEFNKQSINDVKENYFARLDKWAGKQEGEQYQQAVNAYKGFINENAMTGAKGSNTIQDARSFLQDYGLTPDETKRVPMIADELARTGPASTPNSEKNKGIAKRIAKHPVLATAGVMGTIWGVSELKDEDWS